MNFGLFNHNFTLATDGFQTNSDVYYNLNVPQLIEHSLLNSEGTLGNGGTLLVNTGSHTGRSPDDKFIVEDAITKRDIWWEKNKPMNEKNFESLFYDIKKHLEKKRLYVQDLYAGADKNFRFNIRVITELAWHSLFIRHLLRRYDTQDIFNFTSDFTVINCPSFKANPSRHGSRTSTMIAINFTRKLVLICGTQYAGENKKSVFSVLNYLLPKQGVMPMHCSANHAIGDPSDSAVFFGLSGTGKTTLSADPNRTLIGDDEHGWSSEGIFNFEGGCYAKTINLRPEKEPEIFSTTQKFGTVIENMVFDNATLKLDFDDASITPNMRCAYPLNFIKNASPTSVAGSPCHVIMLTCDTYGVFPPVAKLSIGQAIFHFLSGFTSKIAGTEQGVTKPQPTFSTCYGAPFMPLNPEVYGTILGKMIKDNNTNCWLINTGWVGGDHTTGSRIPLEDTRLILDSILNNKLLDKKFRIDENFKFDVPIEVQGVEKDKLFPKQAWKNKVAFEEQARALRSLFVANFKNFYGSVSKNIQEAFDELNF